MSMNAASARRRAGILRILPFVIFVLVVLLTFVVGLAWLPEKTPSAASAGPAGSFSSAVPATRPPRESPAPASPAPFNKTQHSYDDPASPWVIVNKHRPLVPQQYEPPDLYRIPLEGDQSLRAILQPDLDSLIAAAAAQGIGFVGLSGYRSYEYQVSVHQESVEETGVEEAEQYSARPGYSEHQTGLVLDFAAPDSSCTLQECFASTPQGQWLAEHSWQYGFIVRYPKGSESITGYQYEPWHFRYVGRQAAHEYQLSGSGSLEAFFGLPAAP